MIYQRQLIFMQKLIAALSLKKCKTIDVSIENVNGFMPYLEKELIKRKLKQDEDELNLLFSKDMDQNYFDFYRLIENIDPLICERYEDDLVINLSDDLANLLLFANEEFEKNSMLDLAEEMKNMMMKREKVKVMSNAFNK